MRYSFSALLKTHAFTASTVFCPQFIEELGLHHIRCTPIFSVRTLTHFLLLQGVPYLVPHKQMLGNRVRSVSY